LLPLALPANGLGGSTLVGPPMLKLSFLSVDSSYEVSGGLPGVGVSSLTRLPPAPEFLPRYLSTFDTNATLVRKILQPTGGRAEAESRVLECPTMEPPWLALP
jgi:hypothetical protein